MDKKKDTALFRLTCKKCFDAQQEEKTITFDPYLL